MLREDSDLVGSTSEESTLTQARCTTSRRTGSFRVRSSTRVVRTCGTLSVPVQHLIVLDLLASASLVLVATTHLATCPADPMVGVHDRLDLCLVSLADSADDPPEVQAAATVLAEEDVLVTEAGDVPDKVAAWVTVHR